MLFTDLHRCTVDYLSDNDVLKHYKTRQLILVDPSIFDWFASFVHVINNTECVSSSVKIKELDAFSRYVYLLHKPTTGNNHGNSLFTTVMSCDKSLHTLAISRIMPGHVICVIDYRTIPFNEAITAAITTTGYGFTQYFNVISSSRLLYHDEIPLNTICKIQSNETDALWSCVSKFTHCMTCVFVDSTTPTSIQQNSDWFRTLFDCRHSTSNEPMISSFQPTAYALRGIHKYMSNITLTNKAFTKQIKDHYENKTTTTTTINGGARMCHAFAGFHDDGYPMETYLHYPNTSSAIIKNIKKCKCDHNNITSNDDDENINNIRKFFTLDQFKSAFMHTCTQQQTRDQQTENQEEQSNVIINVVNFVQWWDQIQVQLQQLPHSSQITLTRNPRSSTKKQVHPRVSIRRVKPRSSSSSVTEDDKIKSDHSDSDNDDNNPTDDE